MTEKAPKTNSNGRVLSTIQFIGGAVAIAVAGVFALLTYTQDAYPTLREFDDHKDRIHDGAVSEKIYNRDRQELLDRLDTFDGKLDILIQRLPSGTGR